MTGGGRILYAAVRAGTELAKIIHSSRFNIITFKPKKLCTNHNKLLGRSGSLTLIPSFANI